MDLVTGERKEKIAATVLKDLNKHFQRSLTKGISKSFVSAERTALGRENFSTTEKEPLLAAPVQMICICRRNRHKVDHGTRYFDCSEAAL